MVRITANLALIFIVLYGGTSFFYSSLVKRLTTDKKHNVVVASGPKIRKVTLGKKKNEYSIIVTRNIFQAVVKAEDVKKSEKEETKTEELVATSLNLELLGTAAGDDRTGRAIILDSKTSKQDIYQVGDAVQDAIIRRIERGRIVLRLNGRDEELLIKDRTGSTSSGTKSGQAYSPPTPSPGAMNHTVKQKKVPLRGPVRRVNNHPNRKQVTMPEDLEIGVNELQVDDAAPEEELEPKPLPAERNNRKANIKKEEDSPINESEPEDALGEEPTG